MSTFGGFMPEFPQIRVDFFRQIRGLPPPLACFVSHIHSDHLAGLESLKSPFIYCSAATKSLLLRLERYPHRVNFERGILESRKQHFKHLKNLLKPIPLHTPTRIELAPGNDIQVTLFDANHCIGAVMFLIEGNGRAILYTGDIRAEPWFVNALARNPCLIEYTSGLKMLDCIYLDTSFTEDIAFPTKAEGLAELLRKISKYPPTAEFHFAAWTFGYEEVWIALSRALRSQIHVDSYKMRLYESLRDNGDRNSRACFTPEAPILAGYMVGNNDHPGILTLDHTARIHSCERGLKCSHLGNQTIWIKPIIARTSSGQEISEIGIGGGGSDLNQRPEIELDNDATVTQLMKIFADQGDSSILSSMKNMLLAGLHSSRKALVLDDTQPGYKQDGLSFEDLSTILARSVIQQPINPDVTLVREEHSRLPKIITFPYSRHSSYSELRNLVDAFKPKDVFPCTVDEANWHEGVSMRALFGDFCSSNIFRHDQKMLETISNFRDDGSQKSWNTVSRDCSQTSCKHAEYPYDIPDDDYRSLSKGQISNNTAECEATNMVSSQSLLIDRKRSQVPAQSSHPYPVSEAQRNQRIKQPEGDPKSSLKRGRPHGDHTGGSSHLPINGLGIPETEGNFRSSVPGLPGVSNYNKMDGTYYCRVCGLEIRQQGKACKGCGADDFIYYEAISSAGEEKGLGDINPKPKLRKHNRGRRSDVSSYVSRNDTSSSGFTSHIANNEYKMNSSIDNLPLEVGSHQVINGSARDSAECKRVDEKFLSTHDNLEQEHRELIDDQPPSRHDVPCLDQDNSIPVDQSGVNILQEAAHGSPVPDDIISCVQGDSQSSIISSSRLKTRVDAFHAAADNWHIISLMSTGDNHAEESQEL